MKLREVVIKNFRNLVDVSVPIDDVTVLVGENNAGKTAFLDALNVVLTRNQSNRNSVFDNYDYHMCNEGDRPETCEGILLELWFREDSTDEWPKSLVRALADIIQADPARDLNSIGLRLTSKYDPVLGAIDSRWEFLTFDGQPLTGKLANPRNIATFLRYVRYFYLPALRDSQDEFSPRSQFWGRIIRDLRISEEQQSELREELAKLNNSLLQADPRLEQVRVSLSNIKKIMALEDSHNTSIQALPLKPWELMSKSQVVIKGRGSKVHFPLARHGQGMQSVSVFFLFQAYIDVLLKPSFQPETEAILAVEEPAAHLHPHAARALAENLGEVKSQKIVSTHSPYFIQEIPLTQIRVFRRTGASSKVLYVKRCFGAAMPETSDLLIFCGNNAEKYAFNPTTSILSVRGTVQEKEYRDLLTMYPGQSEVHARLKVLRDESKLYLSDKDIDDLENYTKRIRGEVFFARGWLLCEGQSECLMLRYFAQVLGKPLDQAGITVVDFQNNGSPGSFVAMARTFEIPWVLVCDNDDAGKNFIDQVKHRGLTDEEVRQLARPLPEEGADFEKFLFKNGFDDEYMAILVDRAKGQNPNAKEWMIATESRSSGRTSFQVVLQANGSYEIRLREGSTEQIVRQSDTIFPSLFSEVIINELKKDKRRNTDALISRLQSEEHSPTVPQFFASAIADIISKVG